MLLLADEHGYYQLGTVQRGYGTDTGGSVRIPSAFCGLAGLKTTYGRISTTGVWPLAASFDTVGPIAAQSPGWLPLWRYWSPASPAGPGQLSASAEWGCQPRAPIRRSTRRCIAAAWRSSTWGC